MNFRQIELFLALSRTPHVRKVAEQHYLTQAAVSSALKELENEVGTQLFDRLNRRLVLNANGRALQEKLRPLMQQFHDAFDLFKGERMAGHMIIGASATIADYILPELLYRFHNLYPDVKITATSGNSSDIVQGVEQGSLDMGFVEGESHCPSVTFEAISYEEMTIVTSDRNVADAGPYKMADLLGKRWLMRERGSGTRDSFLHRLNDMAMHLNIFLEFDHTESVKKVLLRHPDTLSCMSPYAVANELENEELFIVPVEGIRFSRRFYKALHRNKYSTRPMEIFADMVKTHLETQDTD